MALNFPGGQRRSLCICNEVGMVEEKEGREMLQYFICCRMAEGKSFQNVNSVLNMGSRNEESKQERLVA